MLYRLSTCSWMQFILSESSAFEVVLFSSSANSYWQCLDRQPFPVLPCKSGRSGLGGHKANWVPAVLSHPAACSLRSVTFLLCYRETEIEELKDQLGWMKEDWIEEEYNHVEVELAFLEARREIEELKQVIESMKSSLAEQDKKIQKYFQDISIENKKLEALLQSVGMVQNCSVRDEQCLEYMCDSEGNLLALCATMPDSLITEDQALEKVADSGLLLNEDTANRTDSSEESLTTTTSELSDQPPSSSLENVLGEKLTSSQEEEKISNMMVEQVIQTDVGLYGLDVKQVIQNTFRAQDACSLSPPSSLKELGEFSLGRISDSGIIADLTPSDSNSTILLCPMESPCRKVEHGINENQKVEPCSSTRLTWRLVPAEGVTHVLQKHASTFNLLFRESIQFTGKTHIPQEASSTSFMPVSCSALLNGTVAQALHWSCAYTGTVTKNVHCWEA
uniref:Uncharacterized protein n=1 Tax=Bubo bubo TaxID=30461 RepID=A0A8C0FDC1_BUBBB